MHRMSAIELAEVAEYGRCVQYLGHERYLLSSGDLDEEDEGTRV